MGVAIIGGLISSTLLTLVVVPAAYQYIERFRLWSKGLLARWTGANTSHSDVPASVPQSSMKEKESAELTPA
jgi:hypothetical protein